MMIGCSHCIGLDSASLDPEKWLLILLKPHYSQTTILIGKHEFLCGFLYYIFISNLVPLSLRFVCWNNYRTFPYRYSVSIITLSSPDWAPNVPPVLSLTCPTVFGIYHSCRSKESPWGSSGSLCFLSHHSNQSSDLSSAFLLINIY